MTARFEIKFVVQPYELPELECWMHGAAVFYRPFPPRTVHSVYLDSLDLVAAQQNLDGAATRLKYRIRWYDDSPDQCRFEIKSRRGRMGDKLISPFPITVDEYLDLPESGRSQVLFVTKAIQQAATLTNMSSPILEVKYRREYFQTHHDIRLTIDQGLCFKDLDGRKVHTNSPIVASERIIVEMKFPSSSQQQVAEILKTFPFYPIRHSKYVFGLSLLGRAIYL